MEKLKTFYPVNMFRVCIEAIQRDISGRIFSPLSSEVINFSDIGELLLTMDKLFDKVGYPQAFQTKRTFADKKESGNAYRGVPSPVRDIQSILEQRGTKGTYDIVVMSRRNTSWQGEVYGIDGDNKGEFNGEVELLALLTKLVEV